MNPATASAPRPRHSAWLAALVAAAAGVGVFRGALPYFFAQDDYLGLARARALAPALAGPWRWLSGQAYFTLMEPFGLASAAPYHAVSLATHATNAALLALLLARRMGAPAAMIGAVFYAAHPSLYTAVYSVSGIGELLSVLFVLVTLLLAGTRGATRWLTLPAFLAALACKESVLLLPMMFLVVRDEPIPPVARLAADRTGRAVTWAMAGIATVFAALLFAADVFAVRSGLTAPAPYALSFGPHLIAGAATYLGWAVQPWLPLARGFQDAVDPSVYPAAAIAIVLWAAGFAWPALRRLPWWSGAALALWLIAPVLPLSNHTYHYYLCAPLIGVAMCVAALAAAALGPGAVRPRATWAAAAAVAALLTWNGAAFVHRIETQPFTDPRLRSDALVDRALIARRVADRIAQADLPDGTPLAFWSPWALLDQARAAGGAAPAGASYVEANVRAALMDGLAIRVLFPRLGPASFMHRYTDPPPGSRVVLYDADGTGRIVAPAQVDSMLAAHPIPGARW
jgi:hypothetical protein